MDVLPQSHHRAGYIHATMNIAFSRLRNQRIADRSPADPADVVRWLGAVQAQDYPASLWAIGLRARATEAAVEQALARRTIVRTWPMRGTLHIVAAEDIRWLLELLTPRVLAANAGRYRQLELDDAVFARGTKLVVEALRAGRQLQRTALYRLLEHGGIATRGARGLHILSHLAQRSVICFGAREGRQHTFALLDEWVPPAPRLDRDAALAELTLRYFTSHGPATPHDFAWWSGLTLTDVRAALQQVGARLESAVAAKRTWWFAPGSAAATTTPRAHLLPAFDEYTVGYRDRSDVLSARHANRVSMGGVLNPAIVVDGRIVGTWKRALRKDAVVVTLAPFTRLKRAEREAIEAATERYAAFLGLPAAVSYSFNSKFAI
jgi:hypothetical protein